MLEPGFIKAGTTNCIQVAQEENYGIHNTAAGSCV